MIIDLDTSVLRKLVAGANGPNDELKKVVQNAYKVIYF